MQEESPERIIAELEPLLLPRRVSRMQAVLDARSDHVAFVFEQMVDPHNLSAALRSIDAFAFQDVHLVNPAARIGFSRRIAQGTERWLTVHDHESPEACVEALHEAGYRVLAGHMEAGPPVPLDELDFRRRHALVFGNEHEGVSDQVLTLADGTFRIDMLGFVESLNLSVAAAIAAFHARREIDRLRAEGGDEAAFRLPEARRREIYAAWLKRSVRLADKILENVPQRVGA